MRGRLVILWTPIVFAALCVFLLLPMLDHIGDDAPPSTEEEEYRAALHRVEKKYDMKDAEQRRKALEELQPYIDRANAKLKEWRERHPRR